MRSRDNAVDQRVQDAFVKLSISDTTFLQAARQCIQLSYFGSQITQDLVQICYDFFDQFKIAPQNHFRDEVVSFLKNKDKEDTELYMLYLDRIKEMDPPNQAYVISRINKFVQAREIEKGAVELARMAKDGQFEESKVLMQKMLRVGITEEETGLRYFQNGHPTYLLARNATERLIGTGIPSIDSKFTRGLCRTDFVVILGGYKGKKSWACIHLGMMGLLQGRKVLHITHELSKEDTEMRYDMMLGGMTSERIAKLEDVEIETPLDNGDLGPKEWIECKTVADFKEVGRTRKKVGRLGGDLIIQKYNMGTCTMGEIIRYLDYLEAFHGFAPDILINDYVEKMKIGAGERRDRINEMYLQMKGIADERKLMSVTVSQATREALRNQRLKQDDFAEDIRKLGNADIVYAVSQNEAMVAQNRMLWWVLANRHGRMDYGAKFSQNLDIGQFLIQSWPYDSPAARSRGAGGANTTASIGIPPGTS